jgi:aminobenzoyl-glutamate utilization protein B
MVRAPRPDQLKPIFERVVDIARGAALMTGTRMEKQIISGASNLVLNDTIVDVFQEKMEQIGAPRFNEAEQTFARKLFETFPEGGGDPFAVFLGTDVKKIIKAAKENPLPEEIIVADTKDVALPGSSDVGDVSWVTPTGQIMTTCFAFGTPGHSWQQVAQVGMSIGHKGMLFAAKSLALTALEFIQKPDLLKKARDEFAARLAETPFVAMIPDGTKPPID